MAIHPLYHSELQASRQETTIIRWKLMTANLGSENIAHSNQSSAKQPWYGKGIQAIGVANLLFGGLGLCLLGIEQDSFMRRPAHTPWDSPYLVQAFYGMTSINLACLIVLIIAGACLLRLRRCGLLISNFLFGFEVIYFLFISFLWVIPTSLTGPSFVRNSIVAATGIGGVGITPQIVTGYPIIALVVLNVAYRGLSRRAATSE